MNCIKIYTLFLYAIYTLCFGGFPGVSVGKESACNARDTRAVVSVPGPVRSPGEGHDNPLQYSYSCLENPMDRGALAAYSPWGCKELDTTEMTETSGEPVEPR